MEVKTSSKDCAQKFDFASKFKKVFSTGTKIARKLKTIRVVKDLNLACILKI
jgi:hypothetical protein